MSFTAFDPTTGRPTGPAFEDASPGEVDRAVGAAADAFASFAALPVTERNAMLERVATALEDHAAELCATAGQETGLPAGRLAGELDRTVTQFRGYARWAAAALAPTPADEAGVRRILVPLGPVAVFGSSNFPFAFGVGGTDTAAALAAGCTVVAKSHPAHPQTSALVASVLEEVLPDGSFRLLQGAGHEVGRRLVLHPRVAAVAFTGSLAGGRALFDLAVSREHPIPAYCEMGSLNPVVVTAAAVAERGSAIAAELAGAVGDFAGQRCTKPGLILVEDGADGFGAELKGALRDSVRSPFLDERIRSRFTEQVAHLGTLTPAETVHQGADADGGWWHDPVVLTATPDTLRAERALLEEVFGPAVVLVVADADQIVDLLGSLEPALAASVYAEPADGLLPRSVSALSRLAGRVVLNGAPTGLAVVDDQHHGGPYPATTDARSTSVGGRSVERFLRPVALQGFGG